MTLKRRRSTSQRKIWISYLSHILWIRDGKSWRLYTLEFLPRTTWSNCRSTQVRIPSPDSSLSEANRRWRILTGLHQNQLKSMTANLSSRPVSSLQRFRSRTTPSSRYLLQPKSKGLSNLLIPRWLSNLWPRSKMCPCVILSMLRKNWSSYLPLQLQTALFCASHSKSNGSRTRSSNGRLVQAQLRLGIRHVQSTKSGSRRETWSLKKRSLLKALDQSWSMESRSQTNSLRRMLALLAYLTQ